MKKQAFGCCYSNFNLRLHCKVKWWVEKVVWGLSYWGCSCFFTFWFKKCVWVRRLLFVKYFAKVRWLLRSSSLKGAV